MTGKILENIYEIKRSDQFVHQNLTLIRTLADSELYRYVDSFIDTYMEQYTSFCQDTINDDEETVAWVLNHKALLDGKKELYLDCLSEKINHLKLIDDVQWKSLVLSKNLAVCSMENITNYFFANEKEYDEVLVTFINQNETPEEIETALKTYSEEQASSLFGATVKCNDLNNKKYSALVEGINRYYKSFKIKGIQEDKILILIDLDVIRMNDKEVLKFMREHYPNQVIHFIVKNIKDYCDKILDKDVFNLDEAIALLSSKIHLNYKLKLLNYTSEPISACTKGYPNKLVFYLLKNNFNEDDLPVILSGYSEFSFECQTVIRELLVSHINTIVNEEYPVSFRLLQEAILGQLLKRERLLTLFSFSVNGYDELQAKDCLYQLDQHKYLSLFKGKHPKLSVTTTNKRILDAFVKHKWISSYTTEDGEYRAYGRKIESKEA